MLTLNNIGLLCIRAFTKSASVSILSPLIAAHLDSLMTEARDVGLAAFNIIRCYSDHVN